MNALLPKTRAAFRDIGRRDLRVAIVAAVIQIGGTAGAGGHAHGHGCWWASSCRAPSHLDSLAIALLALGPALLLVRRQFPRAVLAGVFAVALLYVSLGYLQGPNYASVLIAFMTTMFCGDRIAARVAIVAGWVLFLWLPALLGVTGTPSALAAISIAAWLLVLLAGCEAMRGRRERAVEIRRAREQQARARADEERLRIARELHDVLAHNISLINVQSGVALHLFDEQPEQARTALTAIHDASADALREVRSALDVLRGTREQPPRSPAAGLGRLDELVSNARAAGLQVSLDVRGDHRSLPASIDLAAYRIVQESLTNVVRHAGAGSANVQVGFGERELTLEITDDGNGHAPRSRDGTGSGIAGMRERAVALGGELAAEPLDAGGFRVHARLPLDGAGVR